MSKTSGVFQLPNGAWGFRYAYWVDGKQKDIKRTKDDNGNPFKTERAAIKARESAIIRAQMELSHPPKSPKKRATVAEVFTEYCENGRCGKAYGTTRKQDSLWKNHISQKFGKKYVDDISVSEIMDYLSLLYYQEGRAYSYVEAFLKMFYLIFGQAYSRGYLDVDTYNTLCVNKNTKIHMPKMKVDEDDEIVSFSTAELDALDEYFKGTNAETAYMLGRYCGLRINECYGLKWSDIDFDNDCIHVEQQINNILRHVGNLNIFVSKQAAVHIRERCQSVIHIRITLFGFGIEHTEKVNECTTHVFHVKALYVIMEFQMAAKNACVLCIKAEYETDTKHIQTAQSFLAVRVNILFQNGIVQLAYKLTGFDGDLFLTVQKFALFFHKELQTVILLAEILQHNAFRLTGRLFHIVNKELFKIAGDDPTGTL